MREAFKKSALYLVMKDLRWSDCAFGTMVAAPLANETYSTMFNSLSSSMESPDFAAIISLAVALSWGGFAFCLTSAGSKAFQDAEKVNKRGPKP